MTKQRDDFPKKVISRLREQVAYRCSNPDCRIPTAAPGETKDGVNRTGQAAHITAARPGGPRYNATLTQQERRSHNNGIWLCNICAKKIDNAPTEYPTELLNSWKKIAFEKAKYELGKPLPDEEKTLKLISTALTGQPSLTIAQSAIPNIHNAAELNLQEKNPGFEFKTNYVNGATSISIFPNPGKSIKLKFSASNPEEAVEKYSLLTKVGKPISFNIKDIEVEGPDLLTQNGHDEDATIKIQRANPKGSILKIIHIDKKNKINYFDDFIGTSSLGTEGLFFEGLSCGELIHISLTASDNDDLIEPLQLKFNYEKWDNKNIRSLPYLPKAHDFTKNLKSAKEIQIELEIEGSNIFSAVANPKNLQSNHLETLEILYKAREICIELNQNILFKRPELSENDAKKIDLIYRHLTFKRNNEIENAQKLRIDFTCEVKNIEIFKELTKEQKVDLVIRGDSYTNETIMNQQIELPTYINFIKNVKAEIIDEIEKDKTYKVALIPQEGFEYWEGFEINRNKKLIKKQVKTQNWVVEK